MMRLIFFCFVQLFLLSATGQPYVDPFQVRYTYGFHSNHSDRGTPFSHIWAGSDLPVKIKANTYLLISPYYEDWLIDSSSGGHMLPALQGISLPIGLLFPFKNEKWSLMATAIIRSNGEHLFKANTFQYGAATFISYEKSAGKKIRLGAYVNTDFFGFFIMPLLGADWRMNKRNYFFGLLPGRFTWEHRVNEYLYGGITFRAITSSYRLISTQYVRIDDNQLSAFMDIYPAKPVCFTVETGYGMLRKLRMGNEKRAYYPEDGWSDGWFVKLNASFRIRLQHE